MVGQIVTFGHYPQTKAGTDATPISWIVLDVRENKALLLSKYGLEPKPYNDVEQKVTWETCTLRAWLNGEFLNAAFTPEEQKSILLTNVVNGKDQGYLSPDGGNDTTDKIFLLSYAEAHQYLGVAWNDRGNVRSRVRPTPYAVYAGAYISNQYKTEDGDYAGWWWLRSPGHTQNSASYVNHYTSLTTSYVDSDNICVRPALWVDQGSVIY